MHIGKINSLLFNSRKPSVNNDGEHAVVSGVEKGEKINQKHTNVLGQSVLTMVDIHRPGAVYEGYESSGTGRIKYIPERQRNSERVIRTISNSGGGTIAGIEYDAELFKKMGVKVLLMTPLFGYDDLSGHHYWNKNDNQIPDRIGNIDNYETLIRKLYKNGIKPIDDFAVTSFGLESLPAQYTFRWANQNPQTYYWFRMNGLKDGPLTLGLVSDKKQQDLRFRVINPGVIYNPATGKVERNSRYNPKETLRFQIYDVTQVTKEQLSRTNELIRSYQNGNNTDKLAINNSEDTIIPYAFEIRADEYQNRLEEFVRMKKQAGEPVNLDSAEAAFFIGQFTNFKIGKDSEGAVFWDAKKDILKRNYYISGYDEKLLSAISDPAQREYIRSLILKGNCEVQDMAIQSGIYRVQNVKDIQILYTAQMLQGAGTKEDIDKLIGSVLPQEAQLDSETVANVLDGWYNFSRKGIESKEDITIKALMKLPLDALELGDNTVGVLNTSFFSKRASSEETIGLSRYDYYKQNMGVPSPYNKTYYDMDKLYETKLKNFAYEVISIVDKSSQERLLDEHGNYTEYGEYVVDLLGKDIAKYAFLKSIAGNKLQSKMMPDDVLKGKITYNYPELRKLTTLQALGINASSPEEEAKALYRIISEGLSGLDRKDAEYVAKSILKQIDGTTLNGFRLSEVMTDKAGLKLGFRLDAAKDIVDMDAVRNGDMSFDEAWSKVIDFWKKYNNAIKKINSDTYIVAEITDVAELLRSIYGEDADVWNMDLSKVGSKYKNVQDALNAFFYETGIKSEAGYSYTFTDLLRVLSADGEYGNISKNGIGGLKERIQALLNTNNPEYITNLLTFADNHDKPSILHVMALDMELFHTNNLEPDFRESSEKYKSEYYEIRRRNARISVLQELTNSDRFEDLPLEAMMNIDNGAYFKTANTRSAAMSKLIRSAIDDRIPDSFDKKDILKQALVDLTNGNYLGKAENLNLMTITIPELQTLESALDYILRHAGITLSDKQKKAIIEKAKQRAMLEKYAVRGDFDWGGGNHWTAVELQNRAKSVLANGESDFMRYSPYTVSVAALLLDSYKEVTGEKDTVNFTNGTREFVHKYDRLTVESSRKTLPHTIDSSVVQRQKAYASRDIETVIDMVIEQAEFKSGKKFSKKDHDYVMKEVFESATEPAVQKALMYSTFLSALPGIPSVYYRDILVGLGYDEKALNILLQNRNTDKYSEIEEDGPLKEYRTKVFNEFQEVMRIRSNEGLSAINYGMPHLLETNNPDTMAMLYQDGADDIAITILNASGVDPHNRFIYDRSLIKNKDNAVYSININNQYVPVQSLVELDGIVIPASMGLEGMVFVNIYDRDKTEYVVKRMQDGTFKLVRRDGKKIRLNGDTARYGAMFLKKVSRISFKARFVNQQYNFVSNPYQRAEECSLGKNLSLMAT